MARRAAVGVALAVAIAVVAAYAAGAAGRWLVVADPLPARADAIVVLAGAPPARLLRAAELHAAGMAPLVVLSRERRPPAAVALARRGVDVPDPVTQADRQLQALGVPADAILALHGRAFSTTSEARLVARWACRTRRRSLVVVTSPTHTRRARLILHRALGPGVAVAVVPAGADFFPRRWWHSRGNSKLVWSEYQKLVHFWVHERWRLGPCGR